MHFNTVFALSAFALGGVGACTDQGSDLDESQTEEEIVVNYGLCVTSGLDNAVLEVDNLGDTHESYTRTPPDSCPNVSTQVGVSIAHVAGSSSYIEARVDAGTWALSSSFTTAQKKTECENSTLALRVLDQANNELFYQVISPHWESGGGGLPAQCGRALLSFSPPTNKTLFIARAKAIRGAEQFNHGFAREVIEAGHRGMPH